MLFVHYHTTDYLLSTLYNRLGVRKDLRSHSPTSVSLRNPLLSISDNSLWSCLNPQMDIATH